MLSASAKETAEVEVVEETPAQKDFVRKRPKLKDYKLKHGSRPSETTDDAAPSETTEKRPLDMKVLAALNQVVQDPKVLVKQVVLPAGPGKPINIMPTGTGKQKNLACRLKLCRLSRLKINA